jgi:3-hydroxyisobutyrate dehydrogenase-like beta-hydroxyacid dehydrogenase
MGHGMAKNLRAKGYPLALTVHRNRERVADLLAAGATLAATPADLARGSDIVFLCVTGSPQVEAAVSGPQGLLAGAAKGLLIVDTSTAEPNRPTSYARCARPRARSSSTHRWPARRSMPRPAS